MNFRHIFSIVNKNNNLSIMVNLLSQNIIINNINFADKKEVCPGCGCTCPCECKDCEECATCCDH